MGSFWRRVHAFFSLCLLSPAYYGKYFDDVGRLNLQGEIATAVGVVALFFLLAPALTTLPGMPKAIGGWRWKRNQRAGYIALALVVVHLVVLGVKGWLAPQGWHGGIPPVSLVAVVAALVPLLVRRKLEHDKKARSQEALETTNESVWSGGVMVNITDWFKSWKLLSWRTAIAAAIVIYGLVGFFLVPVMAKRLIVDIARERTGREVTVGEVDCQPLHTVVDDP